MQALLVALPLVLAQEATPAPEPSPPPADDRSVTASDLKQRIHAMRVGLLTGGPKVRAAEAEAIGFYGEKVERVERRLDTVRAELTEKRAAYDLALGRALEGATPADRRDAMGDAAALSAQVAELEGEAAALEERRGTLGRLIGAVESRERERERLVTQMETAGTLDPGFAVPMAAIGLAPAAAPAAPESPLADDALVRDLLERDPRAARRLLFEADPDAYWRRFPLHPPADVLAAAVAFPLADLPGSR